MRDVIITRHAVDRYRERIYSPDAVPCSFEVMREQLHHAAQIAGPASLRQIGYIVTRGHGIIGGIYLYCEHERMVMICRRGRDDDKLIIVVTVARLPTDAELRAAGRKPLKSNNRMVRKRRIPGG